MNGLALAVAILLALLAAIVLAARPGARVNRALAAILLLRGGVTFAFATVRDAPTAAAALASAHLTLWYALPFPFLALSLLDALRPGGLPARRIVLPVALVGTLALLTAFALDATLFVLGVEPLPDAGGHALTSGPLLYPLTAASALLEAGLAILAARAAADARLPTGERRRNATLSLAFAAIPLHGAAFLLGFAGPETLEPFLLLRTTVTLAAGALAVASLPRITRALAPGPARAALAFALAIALAGAAEGYRLRHPELTFLPPQGLTTLLVRGAFATLASLALVRFGLAGAGERMRRHVARATAGALALALALLAGGLLIALAGGTTAALAASLLVGGAALALSPTPLRELARRLLLPRDDPAALAERARRYAAALDASLAPDGTLRPEGEALLTRLRDDLGITLREHEVILRALASRTTPAPAGDALLGRYRVERELGRGSFGAAFLARDALTDQLVAVKRFHARDVSLVLREARALAAVKHERIVPLREVDRVGDEVFLVLDYAPGGSARSRLDADGPLPAKEAIAMTLDVLDGLAALHDHGLVHRDIKPENVLLDAHGRALLGDFGSARFLAPEPADATRRGDAVAGSLATLAPEVLRGDPATPASDLHMVAATLYRLLTGDHHVDLSDVDAFEAREHILMDPPRLPHAHVPPQVEAVLRRGLAKRSQERYQSAREMRDALSRASETL